jgi:hypothetical protein
MADADSPKASASTSTGEADTSTTVAVEEPSEPEICVASEPDDAVTCEDDGRDNRPQTSSSSSSKQKGGSYFIDSRLVPRVLEVYFYILIFFRI